MKGIRCVAEFIILVLKKLLLNCMSYMGAADEMELNASLWCSLPRATSHLWLLSL